MGIVVRQSIYTSLISYAGVAVGYFNLLYLYPKFLEPDQVGLLRAIQDAAILMAPFAQIGLAHSITRFYPQFAKNTDNGRNFINLILILSVLSFGIFLLLFLSFEKSIMSFFTEKAGEILHYAPLILWLTFILMVITTFEYYARALLKMVVPNFMREIGTRIFQAILVTLYFMNYISFQQFLILSVLAYALSLAILLLYLIRSGDVSLTLNFSSIPRAKLKELLNFSLFTFVGTSSMIIIGKIDSLMVTGILGLTSTAVYTTAFYMATVIEIPKRAITQTATTIIARAFEKQALGEVEDIYKKTSINQLIVGGLLLIGVWANLDNIFNLMPRGGIYEAGSFVVIVVGAAKLLDMCFGPNSEIITLSKYYRFNIVLIVLLAVTAVGLNYLFIPKYGIIGSAYGTILTILLSNFVRFLFVFFKLGIQPFSKQTLFVLAIIALVSALNLILPRLENIFVDIFYRSFLITLTYGFLILKSNSSTEINTIFNKALQLLGFAKHDQHNN
jgi:O-antigen/teichoic acid export membrane protein